MFPADQQSTFVKYYLKTIGTDIVSEFFKYAGTECGLQISENTLTSEQRTKLLNDMTDEYKSFLIKLNKSLNEQTLDEFYDACESCLNGCSMVLKKVDKKKDRQVFYLKNHHLN